jgi:intracellular multiplication protein IcmE
MNDQPDDFNDDFEEATVQRPAAAKPTMAGNLSAAWQGSPLFKLFVLVIGVAALAAAIIGILSGGDDKNKERVAIGSAPNISAIPGTKAPPAYVEAVNEASIKRADEAIETGKSAMPTPISSDATTNGLGDDKEESNYDPLAEFRPNVPTDTNVAQPAQAAPVETVDSDLLSKMQTQMTSLFESWRPDGVKLVQVVDPSTLVKQEAVETQQRQVAGGKVIIPAGTINYAQMLMEANTDAPGPIMAEILSGPFTGGRAIGAFEVTREYLIIHFTKVTYKKKDYAVDALALDPNTTLGGLVTEKDNRYFTRVLLPSAAAFLEGFGSAIGSRSSTTTVTNGSVVISQGKQGIKDGLYQGLAETGQTIGSFFRDEAEATKPLIRVAVGTPMGLFFVNSVTEGGAAPGSIQTPVQTQPSPFPPPTSQPSIRNEVSSALQNRGNAIIQGDAQTPLANSGLTIIQSR